MKYQYILNGEIIFQTNNVSEYYGFLVNRQDKQAMYSVLYNLLEQSKGYLCNMASAIPQTN